ncbi:hypothetical protein EVAR_34259_1 [Eumeta japonica]|uniref:Uncharacterized protein n=1 Tax=Eumeta variegata TaxID=151549 RepID=A0A4C1VX26_EUMVA|nr:hypothetical protein EVAR_34259_1 [Eumeta japonica]
MSCDLEKRIIKFCRRISDTPEALAFVGTETIFATRLDLLVLCDSMAISRLNSSCTICYGWLTANALSGDFIVLVRSLFTMKLAANNWLTFYDVPAISLRENRMILMKGALFSFPMTHLEE